MSERALHGAEFGEMHGESLTCRLRAALLKGALAPGWLRPRLALAPCRHALAVTRRLKPDCGCFQAQLITAASALHPRPAHTRQTPGCGSHPRSSRPLPFWANLKRAQGLVDHTGSHAVAAALHPKTPCAAPALLCLSLPSYSADPAPRCTARSRHDPRHAQQLARPKHGTARQLSPPQHTMTNSLESSRPMLASVSHCVPTACFTRPLHRGRCLPRAAQLCE